MPGERERPPVEAIDSRIEQSWFKILDALSPAARKQAAVELYATDPEDAAAYVRADGGGQLRLSEIGDLQIKQGKNWRLVKQLDTKLRIRLRLDDLSIRALQGYIEEKAKVKPYRTRLKAESAPRRVDSRADYNEQELRRLRLEKLDLPAYPVADRLIARILESNQGAGDYIDITDGEPGGGQEQFCRPWKRFCGDLPLPCTPPKVLFEQLYPGRQFPDGIDEKNGDFWYLMRLAENAIVKNVAGAPQPILPRFEEQETMYAMDWVEENFDAEDGAGNPKLRTSLYSQPLLEALSIKCDGVVNISRKIIDKALWEGDPSKRQPTDKHQAVIRQLGFNPDEWEFHCIRQDQYARGSEVKQWGRHELYTHYEDYFFGGGVCRGLLGGFHMLGGASRVDNSSRDSAHEYWAVRLVLSRKHED